MNGEMNLEEMKKSEEMKKIILRKILSKEAMERLGRIRLVKPELANQLELYLVQLFQAGKINREITEEQIKMILEKLTERKKFRFIK